MLIVIRWNSFDRRAVEVAGVTLMIVGVDVDELLADVDSGLVIVQNGRDEKKGKRKKKLRAESCALIPCKTLDQFWC